MESLWKKYTPEQKKETFDFCEGYKAFMSACKTERECVWEFTRLAEEAGYKNFNDIRNDKTQLKAGDKVYAINRQKMLMLVQIGSDDMEKGLAILGAHIDSPRLDLKPHPLYEDTDFAMMKTHYYGGIKKFQWVTLPLALHGVVAKKDGSTVTIRIGDQPGDPVFGISDVLPHLAKDQRAKSLNDAFTGEDLNLNVGSQPADNEEDEAVKKNILSILKDKYGIEEDDFESAELEVVPAGAARDFGFDRSMVFAYGHDDRICAYTSVMAQLSMKDRIFPRTFVTLLVDKEEIGSVGATGMHSRFFENTMAEIMDKAGQFSELKLRRMLSNSKMLSSDVSAGFDPNYASVYEKNNAPYLNKGPVLHKYTGSGGKSGSNDATAEYIASLRKIWDESDVQYQIAELGKVDQGGGGTIAYILAQYSMDVIDLGIALHNMHAPWEVAAKTDIYEGYRAYRVFLQKI